LHLADNRLSSYSINLTYWYVAVYLTATMSDYEEEHFPVAIRTSFSSSFDAAWRESAGVTDFAPIRRSFSEFYRGERITVDTVGHIYEDEFQNVSSTEELQNAVDDNSDFENSNCSSRMKLGSGSSCVIGTKKSVCDVQSRSHPEVDVQIGSSVSDHCSVNSEGINGYDSTDTSSETKFVSPAENSRGTVNRSDPLLRTRLGKELTHSQHGSGTVNDVVRQRIVSEIRNNIPDVGNVKSCSETSSDIRQPSPDTVLRGEFAHFRKRSPGVAKRLEATTPSKSESIDMSVFCSDKLCDTDEAVVVGHNPECSSNILTEPSALFKGSVAGTSRMNMTVPAATADETSVENASAKLCEHSNIDSSLMSRIWDTMSDDSARATDPFRYSGMLPDAVLFTTCDDPVADQTIRLSPQLTECDSDNVSTLEEDNAADAVSGCLPVVEDGLSCSDTDEMLTSAQNSTPPSNFSSAAHSDVAEVDISQKFPVSETEVMDFFSGTADGGCDTRAKDDPVERAIRDIRLAMERSKGFAETSPRKSQSFKPQSSHSDENVWVSRAM